MLTIFEPFPKVLEGPVSPGDPRLFLDINCPEGYTLYVGKCDLDNVDIVLIDPLQTDTFKEPLPCNYKIALWLDIWCAFENKSQKKYDLAKNHFRIHEMYDDQDLPNTISCKFIFNWVKSYHSRYPFDVRTHRWANYGDESYVVDNLLDADRKQKIFISLLNVYPKRKSNREKLYNEIVDNFQSKGYVSRTKKLYAQIEFPWPTTISELETCTRDVSYHYNYSPPHIEYYKNTFISIYAESAETGTSIIVSEKTFDPLIKGHFILPFAIRGFIKYVESEFRFRFPDFIDYSYDDISDDEQRYQAYIKEVYRLLSIDLDTWKTHWNENLDLLLYNKRVFHETPYDRIDLVKLISGV
jgi:hypothetical protein